MLAAAAVVLVVLAMVRERREERRLRGSTRTGLGLQCFWLVMIRALVRGGRAWRTLQPARTTGARRKGGWPVECPDWSTRSACRQCVYLEVAASQVGGCVTSALYSADQICWLPSLESCRAGAWSALSWRDGVH